MDSDRRSAQVERLEVVDTGRRRRWSEDDKLKIVLETLSDHAQLPIELSRRAGVFVHDGQRHGNRNGHP